MQLRWLMPVIPMESSNHDNHVSRELALREFEHAHRLREAVAILEVFAEVASSGRQTHAPDRRSFK